MIPTAPPTTPRGALSPNLAAQLDRLSDRGRQDRILSALGLPNETQVVPAGPDQLELFQYDTNGDAVGYNGETL